MSLTLRRRVAGGTRHWRQRWANAFAGLALAAAASGGRESRPDAEGSTRVDSQSTGAVATLSEWRRETANPVLGIDREPAGLSRGRGPLIWNDPSVIFQGGEYVMWASLGRGGPAGVAIYKLRSKDGVAWRAESGGRPVLEPGSRGRNDFDWLGVETPHVIRVGEQYHMYYSAYSHGKIPLVTMGHATSGDGIVWRKQGELSSLTATVGRHAGNPWGRLARAEPAAVHHESVFYLYYTDVRCRSEACDGNPRAVRGISLATSRDGHVFEPHGTMPIVLQSSHYPATEGWEGYSTPWVFRHEGKFEMFCDVFRQIGNHSVQAAIVHLRSDDGIRFVEVERDVMVAGVEEWAAVSVRSPSVLVDGNEWKMWYAGDNYDPALDRARAADRRLRAGIGLARRARP